MNFLEKNQDYQHLYRLGGVICLKPICSTQVCKMHLPVFVGSFALAHDCVKCSLAYCAKLTGCLYICLSFYVCTEPMYLFLFSLLQ